MNLRCLIALISIILWPHLCANSQVSGQVFDKSTGTILPFVHVINLANSIGVTSDIDGKFSVPAQEGDSIRFSFVGYKTLDTLVLLREEMMVFLTEQAVELQEAIILPGENPAHRIIQRAIDHKNENNPEKHIGYKCDTYNKLIFTAEPDSVLLKDEAAMASLDSSDIRALDFFEGQHLLVMESITERSFNPPDQHHERIKASRMSGLQSPDFALLATQIQSFSFYEEQIQVLSTNYLSPLAKSAIRKYSFELRDTLLLGLDSVYIIEYQPRPTKNFQGLKGLLYIHTNGYALQHVIAQPADTLSPFHIEIKQKYEHIDGLKWFPVQLSSKMIFENAVANGFPIIGLGKSYLKNIQLDPTFSRKDFNHVLIQMEPIATRQPDDFWNVYRQDSLDVRELRTYEFMDSVGKAEKLDVKIKALESLLDGNWSQGFIDIELNKLLSYNNYEGLRLGFGAHTNDRLASWMSIGGYGAFGTKDHMFKYGGDVRVIFNQLSNTYLRWTSSIDVRERGSILYGFHSQWMAEDKWYELYINKMDQILTHQIEFHSQLPWYMAVNMGLNIQKWHIPDDYRFRLDASESVYLTPSSWNTTSVFVQFRFAFKEKWIQTMNRRRSLGTNWPILKVRVEKGLRDVYLSQFEFLKWSAQLDYKKLIALIGELHIRMDVGKVDKPLPAFLLFNFKGSSSHFGLVTPFAFETMPPGSFMANEFATLTLRHNFKDYLLRTPKFAPYIILVHNMGWGTLLSPDLHLDSSFKSLENGYLESGIEIRNLLKTRFTGLGIGFFHRYGAAAQGTFKQDAAIKINTTFTF